MSTPVAAAPAAAPSSSAPSAPASASSSPAPSTSSSPSGSASGSEGSKAPVSGQSENTAGSTPAEKAAEQIRRMKLKVGGREVELEEPEVIRKAQLAEGAEQKFREAAEMRKQATQLLEALRTNPMAVLTHPELGINFREIAEQYLGSELQKELMSPEQRELMELREFRRKQEEAAQAQAQQHQTAAQRQAEAEAVRRAQVQYDRDITEVLQKSQLPKSTYTVKRVAEVLMTALEKGYELDVPTAVDMVRERYVQDIQAMVGALDGEAMIKMLGDGVVGKLRKHDLARIKAKLQEAQPAAAPQTTTEDHSSTRKESEMLRPAEWLKQMRQRAGV